MIQKQRLNNRILSLVLALVMVFSMLPMASFTAFAADATTEKNITLGATHIKGAQASNVYFGTYKQSSDGSGGYNVDPIKWRVLSNTDGKLFLLSDQNLDVFRYHTIQEGVTWETSTMRSWLNGYGSSSNKQGVDYTGDNFIGSAFSSTEKGVIADTTVVNDDNPSNGTEGGSNTTDKVFLLSIAEVQNTVYGFTNNTRTATNTAYVAGGGKIETGNMYGVGEADFWWLRSPGYSANYAAMVGVSGSVYVNGNFVNYSFQAVRPAFNINLSSVLFTSAAKGGKSSSTSGDGIFENVDISTLTDSDGYKLTLLDSSRNAFEATLSGISDNTVTVSYSGAKTGANEYISAIVKNGDTVKYYGRLGLATENGTAMVTLPDDFNAVNGDVLCIFNEQYNGDYKTDYASELIEIGYKITIDANGGECATASLHTLDGKLTSLPEATNTCYELLGWYDAKTGGTKITTDTVFTADTTVYAQWKPVYWTDEGNYDISWYDANEYSYYINDGADLAGLAVLVNGMNGETATDFSNKMVFLNAEIDLSKYLWTPIGTEIDNVKYEFKGQFEGQNKTISNLTINDSTLSAAGLFGYLSGSGQINNVGLVDAKISCGDGRTDGEINYTGGIAAVMSGSTLVRNCYVSGSVKGEYVVGGIVGDIFGSAMLMNSYNMADVLGIGIYDKYENDGTRCEANVGGVVGTMNGGEVRNCYNLGSVELTSDPESTHHVGGVTARVGAGSLLNVYNAGTVKAPEGATYVGSISAYVSPPSTYGTSLTNCYYLKGTAAEGLYSAHADLKANVTEKESPAFASGEVAWLLNDSADGGSTWRQNLDNGKTTDDYPVLLSTHDKVYQIITYAQCDKGDTSPIITYSNNDTSDVVPAHVYQYSATDHVITETCKNCETHTETATIKIDSSAELVYAPDTEHKPAMVEYSDGWLGGTLTVTYENNINAGTDTAKAIIEKGDAKATLAFSIRQATNEWTTAPTISGWTYGGAANAPTYEAKFGNGDVVVTYTGTTSSGEDYAASTTPPTEAGDYTATFTVEETTNYSGLTETKEFTVSTASIEEAMVAVSDVAYTGKEQEPTVTVTLGGKTLTENTDYIVSYSGNTDLGTATVTVTGKGNYTGDATGSFEIDYLVTDAEAAVSGTKGANDWYISMVTLTAPTGYTISKTVDGGYANTISYDAEQNGTVTYYLQNTNGEIAQKTLALKIDLTAPTAQYNIKGNGWREFVNSITFGIFCKDNADLTIQASDTMDSAVTVEYVISKTELNAEDITDWNTYTDQVALNPQAKNYIYIRITDDAGHTVVYESGVVVFTDCTESVSIEYYKDTDGDVAVPIAFNGNTVKGVKYGDNLLTDGQYTRTNSGITFDAEYLDTFAASDTPYTFTVSYHPMGVEMGVDAKGDTLLNRTFLLKKTSNYS